VEPVLWLAERFYAQPTGQRISGGNSFLMLYLIGDFSSSYFGPAQ
jgi:hypothetical protein